MGIESPQNLALGDVQLSDAVVTAHSQLTLTTTLRCTGSGGTHTVELLLEDLDPTLPVVRDDQLVVPESRLHSRQELTLPENGSQELNFQISSLDLGVRHARLRITSQDALPIDNTRFVTVSVRTAVEDPGGRSPGR